MCECLTKTDGFFLQLDSEIIAAIETMSGKRGLTKAEQKALSKARESLQTEDSNEYLINRQPDAADDVEEANYSFGSVQAV